MKVIAEPDRNGQTPLRSIDKTIRDELLLRSFTFQIEVKFILAGLFNLCF